MRKIFVSVIFVVLMCMSANADIVYLTESGGMGSISVTDSFSVNLLGIQYTSTASDPFLASYWNGSDSRVILIDRTTNTQTSGDAALIFKPDNLTTPENAKGVTLAGTYNTQAALGSYNGKALFTASGASIHQYDTGDFSVARVYTYSADTEPEIISLATGTTTVYALVRQETSRDIMLVFDGQLRDDVSQNYAKHNVSDDAECFAWLNGTRLALAHSGGVSIWSNNRWNLTAASDAPVKALCRDGGDGFYFAEQEESNGTYTTRLRHYSSNTKTISTLYTDDDAEVCCLVRDEDNNLLGAVIGDNILVYNMDIDNLLAEYDSESLGGEPVMLAMSYVKGDDGKTKSGCDIAGAGIIMILAGALIFRKN